MALWLSSACLQAQDFTQLVAAGQDVAITTHQLNLRTDAASTARVLTILPAGARLTVLAQAPEQQTIDGLTSNWYLVQEPQGTPGWCFGGYLRVYSGKEWSWHRIQSTHATHVARVTSPATDLSGTGYSSRQLDVTWSMTLALPADWRIHAGVFEDSGQHKVGEYMDLTYYEADIDPRDFDHAQSVALGFPEPEVISCRSIVSPLNTIQWTVSEVEAFGPATGLIHWYPNTFEIWRGRWMVTIMVYEGVPETTTTRLRSRQPEANERFMLDVAGSVDLTIPLLP